MPDSLKPPRSALVIAMRYLGDVLLTTPLVHALHERYPDCQIDMLVFDGTQAILQNNPDIRQVFTIAERPGRDAIWTMIRRLWRRYDLAVVPQPGDKPHLFGLVAAPVRYGFVPGRKAHAWWKRLSVRQPLEFDEFNHRVFEGARLAQAMGLGPSRTMVPPTAGVPIGEWGRRLAQMTEGAPDFDARQPFAVVHPSPRVRYKQWHTEGWRALLEWLAQRGVRPVLSGGPGQAESAYIDGILDGLPAHVRSAIVRVQGKLSLAELADLLRHARLYVGVDTATTHLAAACGTPTVALYGPSDPRMWGPYPQGGLDRAWEKAFARQTRRNVIMLQTLVRDCVPCQFEGCERHRGSHSDCLDELETGRVLAAAETMLARTPQERELDVAAAVSNG